MLFRRIHDGIDDGFVPPMPVPIRKDVAVLLCNLPRDLTAAEADKLVRVIEALKPIK